MNVRSAVERIRQPEYTGENRCTPCTLVNLVIAVVVSVVLAVVSIPVGVLAFLVSVGAISLRGYLVPGTPALTKHYFPDWVLRRFDKLPEERHGGTVAARANGTVGTDSTEPEANAKAGATMNPEGVLLEAGAVAPCEDEDDLCLEPAFRRAWRGRVMDLREQGVEAADALDALGVDGVNGSLSHYGDAITLERDGTPGRTAQWESRAALLADVAAANVLDGRFDGFEGWDGLDSEARGGLLYALRLFVEACPACDGRVSLAADTVESCCRSVDVAAVTCEACGARLFEQQV